MAFAYYLTVLLGVLVSVSFYTLYERKVLGAGHTRLGPVIIGWWGLLQPFSDAVKLFSKEWFYTSHGNFAVYLLSPLAMLLISLLAWVVMPFSMSLFTFKLLGILFFILIGFSVYTHLGMGWASNSNYSMIGGLRCVAQSLSYEVSLAFVFMTTMFLANSMDLNSIVESQQSMGTSWVLLPLAAVWVISSLAETNRSPFDFAEGESELVSGFNVEYGGGLFAFMFMAEYTGMIMMSTLLSVLFFGNNMATVVGYTVITLMMTFYIWARASYPRTRYDKLMMVCWLLILPSVLALLIVAQSIL